MTDNNNAPIPYNENIHSNRVSRKPELLFNPLILFIVIAIAFSSVLFLAKTPDEKPTDDMVSNLSPVTSQVNKPASLDLEVSPTAKQKAVPRDTGIPLKATDNRKEKAEESAKTEQARRERIRTLAEEIYETLKKEEAITSHTLFLKSGEELDCTLIKDMGTHWKIRYKGMTTIIDKNKVESMKSRAPGSVETELQKMALERATIIVDRGLVRYEDEWITPEQKELRIHVAKTEAEIKKLEAQRRAGKEMPPQPEQATPKRKSTRPEVGGRIDTSAITVAEGFGFGDIVIGHPQCTREFIISKLGKPDMEKQQALIYDSICGMTFVMATDMDMLIEIHLTSKFEGKLLSGISFSSTVHDIFEVYGDPVEEETVDDLGPPYGKYRNRILYRSHPLARLAYRDLGILFFFEDDRITQIVIHRK